MNEGPPDLTPTECVLFDLYARHEGERVSSWKLRSWIGSTFSTGYIKANICRLRKKVNRPGTGWRLEPAGMDQPRGKTLYWYATHRLVRVPPVDSQAAPL